MTSLRGELRLALLALGTAIACGTASSDEGGETHWFGDCAPWLDCPEHGLPRTPVPAFESCGDDIVQEGEQCDGTNLGGETCSTGTMNARPIGTLTCSPSCTLDLSRCSTFERSAGGSPGVGGTGGTGGGFGAGGLFGGGYDAGSGGAGGAPLKADAAGNDASLRDASGD